MTTSTDEATPLRARDGWLSLVSRSPATLWTAFVLVHLLLGMLCLHAPGLPMGDVSIVYKEWMREAVAGDGIVGIDHPFVYPVLAFIPMAIAWVFGPDDYDATWLLLVFVLDALGFAVLVGGYRRRLRNTGAAWWWLLFLALLGPIALGRIDAVTVPLAIAGMLWLGSRPRAAAVVLTIATWIKVWPAAILLAAVIVQRTRRTIVGLAAAISALIVAVSLVLGSGTNVFSFVGDQTSRGLQVEAPVSTIWMWLALLGAPGAKVFYDKPLNTFEVAGQGADLAATLMTPLLALAVILIVLLGVLALRSGARATTILPTLAFALTVALIAFNKVGSPQYICWLAVPAVAGCVALGRRYRTPLVVTLVIAGLTQIIYPFYYVDLLNLVPAMVVILTVRNLLLFVLLGWLVRELATLARIRPTHDAPDRPGDTGASDAPTAADAAGAHSIPPATSRP